MRRKSEMKWTRREKSGKRWGAKLTLVGRGGASVTGLCLVTIQPSKETERNEQHKTSKTHAYPQVTYKIYCFLRTLNLQLSLTPPNTSLIILTVLHSSWDTYIGRWTRNLEIRTLNKPTLYIWILLLSHLSPNLHSNKPFFSLLLLDIRKPDADGGGGKGKYKVSERYGV